MAIRSIIASIALMLGAAQPAAAAQCTAEYAAERMDAYFAEQRGPQTWRALSGLGDPRITPADYLPANVASNDEQHALLKQLLPSGQDASIYSYIDPGECRIDHALAVGQRRLAALGDQHPYFAAWVKAQRAVFGACRGRSGGAEVLPQPVAVSDPAVARLQRDDRAYQAASLQFYRSGAASKRAFARIAGSSSEHAPIARYMLLAIDAEAGTVAAPAMLKRADAVLADQSLASIHPLVQGLIGSIGWNRGDPQVRRRHVQLAIAALKAPSERLAADSVARDRYARAAADIHKLHGRFDNIDWWITGAIPDDAVASRAMAQEAKTDRLAAWLLFGDTPYDEAAWAGASPDRAWPLRHYLGEAPDTLEWNVLRAAFSESYDPARWDALDRMTAEAQACRDAGLAAAPVLFHHQVRTALASGDAPAAEAALARIAGWPWKQSRHFRQTRTRALDYLAAKGRLAEARRLGALAAAEAPDNGDDLALLLLARDEDAFVAQLRTEHGVGRTELLNLLPAGVLARLAARPNLKVEERARFARVAWTRYYAAGRKVPSALDRLMRSLNPEITGGWTSRPGAGARDPRLLLDVLRSPGLNILIVGHGRWPGNEPGLTGIDVYEHSDNNWWCAWQPERHRTRLEEELYGRFFGTYEAWPGEDPLRVKGTPGMLALLLRESWAWRAQDAQEEAALAAIECAPKLLAGRAAAWAERPGLLAPRSGMDEALALAVRATRYGCQRQGGHGAYSRKAFHLLHKRFPGSAAAKRTRWWFDCSHFSRGCGVPPPPAN